MSFLQTHQTKFYTHASQNFMVNRNTLISTSHTRLKSMKFLANGEKYMSNTHS